jgi:predicted TPR repeat methyltransferase
MANMSTLFGSSGDFSVDRQYDFVQLLEREGDVHAALDLMRDIIARAPNWTWGWFKLGQLAQSQNETDLAISAWQKACALDPSDRLGAGPMLSVIGAQQSDQMPTAFVETLFDQYADRFDASLVDKLHYCVPERMGALVCELHPDRFKAALDLGCGTGLAGAIFRPVVDHLSGFDLSQSMLRKAQKRGIYDSLSKADVLQLPKLTQGVYDLVVAADVLIYLGALNGVVDWVKSALLPNGIFAFSIETTSEACDFALGPSRRYRHSSNYVCEALNNAGFTIICMSDLVLRKDRGDDVDGMLVVARLVPVAIENNAIRISEDLAPKAVFDRSM